MPWKVTCPVNERFKFVARLENGERMTDLCRELGISRKTGYKFLERFKRLSVVGLADQPRAPERSPQQMSEDVARLILALRRTHPTWGPRKLLATLKRKEPGIKLPTHSTVSRLLSKHELVVRRPRRHRPTGPTHSLSTAESPHDLLCMDYKGEFRLGNGKLCYPFTLTDQVSRYVLACEGFHEIDGAEVRRVLELVFRDHGVPKAMRFDGGAPFASNALWGWSWLSVWLLRLGIRLEQTEPASPEQNGRHERMHRTLKAETTRPAAANLLQQQERFTRWVDIFNNERPHEALGQNTPASVYRASPRKFPSVLEEPKYPLHDLTAVVGPAGHIRIPGSGRKLPQFFVTAALRGQKLGLRELDSGAWLVSFLDFDIGQLDLQGRQFQSYPPPCSLPSEATPEASTQAATG